MADKTGIAWTEATWNPLAGCSRVSEGCRHCYAELLTYRLGQSLRQAKYKGLTRLVGGEPQWTGAVRLWLPALDQPLRWTTPRRIFVNSMSDLFHEKAPAEWIDRIFAVMALAPQHTFQVLTKRPEKMRDYLWSVPSEEHVYQTAWEMRPGGVGARTNPPDHPFDWRWPLPNVWLGVSVEDQATAEERIPLLLETPAAVRWVSYEPALGPVNFKPRPQADMCLLVHPHDGACKRRGLDWLVVGGESGPGARPFDVAWARGAIAQCRAAGVPVFVKQLGARPMVQGSRRWPIADRKGAKPAEWPQDLRVREYPADAPR